MVQIKNKWDALIIKKEKKDPGKTKEDNKILNEINPEKEKKKIENPPNKIKKKLKGKDINVKITKEKDY